MRLILLILYFIFSGMTSFASEVIAAKETPSVVSLDLSDSSETTSADEVSAAFGPATVSVSESETKLDLAAENKKTDSKIAVDTRAESEIPLNLQNGKKAEAGGTGVFRIIFSLAVLGVLGFGAFYVIRKYSVPRTAKHQTQIKVLQQHYLGPKKSLAIIRVAGESILVGVTDHNINLIKSLALLDDEVPEEAPSQFNSVISSYDEEETEVKAPTSGRNKSNLDSDLSNDEEFAISGIKDIVSKRLKGMRSFQ